MRDERGALVKNKRVRLVIQTTDSVYKQAGKINERFLRIYINPHEFGLKLLLRNSMVLLCSLEKV